ncbi:type II toxin-antitoxin system VapC family toxin [Anabaena azotica]|uniref:type II toxin-antitoxin system VapC family toxin n=1 Tax=Anabaena azotica TaxID=197653 RepID=UPI0039A5D479
MGYLLDTNIVTAVLKQNPKVTEQLKVLNRQNEEVFISAMTYYEIERGFLAIKAVKKLSNFENSVKKYQVLLLDNRAIFQKASEIYADLKQRGLPIQDADIFIAATAIFHNLILVSHDSDLSRITGLQLQDWLQDE